MPKIILGEANTYDCSFCGLASSGTLYADLLGITLKEALEVFSDSNSIKKITYSAGESSIVYLNYTELVGVEKVSDGNAIRVSLRRPYLTDSDEQALEEAKAEAAEYKAALELLGITTEEVAR